MHNPSICRKGPSCILPRICLIGHKLITRSRLDRAVVLRRAMENTTCEIGAPSPDRRGTTVIDAGWMAVGLALFSSPPQKYFFSSSSISLGDLFFDSIIPSTGPTFEFPSVRRMNVKSVCAVLCSCAKKRAAGRLGCMHVSMQRSA